MGRGRKQTFSMSAGGRQAVRNILDAQPILSRKFWTTASSTIKKEENRKEKGKIDIPGIRSSLIRSELSLMLCTKHIVS